MKSDFAVFILTHGRPDNVITYSTLRRSGYTGKIYLIIDNLDATKEAYIEKYRDEVIVFDKKESSEAFDIMDNFNNFRGVVYARNANFKIAESLGIKYFIQLDDDYRHFQFRFGNRFEYAPRVLKDLDRLFEALLKFYKSTPIHSIAIAQGGDFIGGEGSPQAQTIKLMRKCMNLFVLSTERPFNFIGRLNEDVNAYVSLASVGRLMFTINQVTLEQMQTQANPGGLTELYLDSGTYVKSFYSVICQPSSVTVKILHSKNSRLHHSVKWVNTAPYILREDHRKRSSVKIQRKS